MQRRKRLSQDKTPILLEMVYASEPQYVLTLLTTLVKARWFSDILVSEQMENGILILILMKKRTFRRNIDISTKCSLPWPRGHENDARRRDSSFRRV